ncbi:MAG: hypothetical protein ACK5K7_04850 [Bacilli bacterium]
MNHNKIIYSSNPLYNGKKQVAIAKHIAKSTGYSVEKQYRILTQACSKTYNYKGQRFSNHDVFV